MQHKTQEQTKRIKKKDHTKAAANAKMLNQEENLCRKKTQPPKTWSSKRSAPFLFLPACAGAIAAMAAGICLAFPKSAAGAVSASVWSDIPASQRAASAAGAGSAAAPAKKTDALKGNTLIDNAPVTEEDISSKRENTFGEDARRGAFEDPGTDNSGKNTLSLSSDALAEKQEETAARTKKEETTIFIGDSRTVGIYWALTGDERLHTVQTKEETDAEDDTVWSCKEGIGLQWMEESGVPYAENYIGDHTSIVILMGVNDIAGSITPRDYLDYLNAKAASWTSEGASVSYVSVNPVRSEVGGITNDLIENWNSAIINGLSSDISYIDTNTRITGHIDFKDALHYKDDTNLEIYNIICSAVNAGDL